MRYAVLPRKVAWGRGVFGTAAGFKKALNLTQEGIVAGGFESACFGRISCTLFEEPCRSCDCCGTRVALIGESFRERLSLA